jgi:hypothetical protein
MLGFASSYSFPAAARLPGSERKDLAILALARSERVSDLAARRGGSRKFKQLIQLPGRLLVLRLPQRID